MVNSLLRSALFGFEQVPVRICYRKGPVACLSWTLVAEILRGFVMIAAIVLPSAAANVVCQVIAGISVDITHKSSGAVVTAGAMVAG